MRNKIPHLCHYHSKTEPWELSKHIRKVIFHFNTHIQDFPAESRDCGKPIGHFLHRHNFQRKMSHLDNWESGEKNPHCFHSSGYYCLIFFPFLSPGIPPMEQPIFLSLFPTSTKVLKDMEQFQNIRGLHIPQIFYPKLLLAFKHLTRSYSLCWTDGKYIWK